MDWNVDPPDNNTGIFREVTLHFNSGISIENPFVETRINPGISREAALTVETELVNHSGKNQSGILKGVIDNIHFSKQLALAPGERY